MIKSKRSAPFIAFTGVMGVGKTSLAEALAEMMCARAFIEPGAEHWPVPPGEKWEDHVMELEQWVRSTNLRLFKDARITAVSGTPAIADGGLFLLAKECMDDAACRFYYGLMSETEKQILRVAADSDWHEAPCPDVLILVETDITSWKKFLAKRGRDMDGNLSFIKSYIGQQRIIKQAAIKFAAEKGIQLICYDNHFSDLSCHARELHRLLVSGNLVASLDSLL